VATLGLGESGAVNVPLDRALPNGPWDARITLRSGVTSESGTARLTFPTDKATAAPVTVLSTKGEGDRTRLAMAAGLTLALLTLWAAIRRRRKRTHVRLLAAVPLPPT
jgi:hypothetical protein